MFPPPGNARKPLGLTHNAPISTQYLKVHTDNYGKYIITFYAEVN